MFAWVAVTEVVTSSLLHDPNMLRLHLMNMRDQPTNLLGLVLDAVISVKYKVGAGEGTGRHFFPTNVTA
jgi:hypothetical protein